MNYFHSTNPASRFRDRVLVSRVGTSTRTLMIDFEVRRGRIDQPSASMPLDAGAYGATLLEEFGIALSGDEVQRLFDSIASRTLSPSGGG